MGQRERGNDSHGNIQTISDIQAHYRQEGLEFKKVINECRDYSKSVPIYENPIGTESQTAQATVSRPSDISGEIEPAFSGNGAYNESDYWANFEISREDFEQAIISGRYEHLLSAVNAGVASIEAFLNHEYMIRLGATVDDLVLRESLEPKMKSWPEILAGSSFDLSTRSWGPFVELKRSRDDGFQHGKPVSTGITRHEYLKLLKLYNVAIARLLVDLHIHFGHRCPTAIIRCAFHPEIELANQNTV
ncbi:MAG: hypothetical protein MUO22_03960 [Sedimentisphaerales bacterium]|nr:hypothetical protein [Sedimentisphaerales bacterium]